MATEIVSVTVEELPDEIQETLSAIGAHENVEHIIKAEPGDDFIVTVDPCEDANDYFVIEEYEEPSEPIQHPSVGTTKEEFMVKLRSSSQCFLCTGQMSQSRARIEQHFVRVHLDHGMNLAGKLVVICRLGCKKDGHYHCPHAECLFSCKNQPRLRLHYRLNHEPCSDTDAIFLLQEEESKAVGNGITIKQEPNDYEDAMIGPDSDHVLTEIYGGEDEMADVHPAKMSETLQGVSDMYKHSMDAEGKMSFMQLLSQPSEKPSIAHSRDELLARLTPPHCFLCPDLVISPRSRLLRHFTSLHMNHSIKVANFFVAACKLECSRFTLSHYHCPYPNCLATVKVKHRLVGHFKKHLDYIRSGHKLEQPQCGSSPVEVVSAIPNQINPKRVKKSLFLNEEVSFPPPKKTFEFQGVPFKPHPSFGANAAELFERLCLPFCYLCYDHKTFMRMPRLERHFKMAHLNRAVDCGSVYLVQCGLDCMGAEPGRKHYHCPYCPLKDCRRCAFWIHLEMHRREGHVAEHLKMIRPDIGGTIKTQEIGTPSGPITISFSHNFDNETIVTTEIPAPTPTKPWKEMYRGLPVKKRPGIHTSKEEVLAAARLPNCYLCNSDKDYICQRRLVAHITRCHLKLFFALDQFVVLLCKLWCGEKLQDKGHYHCLFCDYVAAQKNRVKKHVMKHVRNVQRKADTAEFHLPEVMEDHSVPEEWLSPENRDEVLQWEYNFNDFLTNTYVKNAKTNNNILTEKKKYVVFNHTRFNYEIEERSLKYWVRFRSVKVISCEQLGLKNVLVMPLTKYNTDSENRAINVQQEPRMEDFNLVLSGDDPEKEFLLCYRIIPTLEEMFKLLYELHVIKSNHPSSKTMFGEIRRKYLYFPRAVVDKFVMFCPTCGVHMLDKSNELPPVITVKNADSINLAALQVTVVDMTEHPDGQYRYVVECFDRCSRLTWLIPSERTVPSDLAELVTRHVLSVIGLPGLMLTNCGEEFLDKMLQEIDRRWYGSCVDFINLSRDAAQMMMNDSSDDLMEALQELVSTPPTTWASALPHLQFRLNHTRGHQPTEQSPYEQVFGRQRSRPNWQHFLTSASASHVSRNPPLEHEDDVCE